MTVPKLKTPPGACDTHMHFYDARYPTAPTANFTPPDAQPADYRTVQKRLGLERVVIVQPSTYGRDNACQLEAMSAFGNNARCVLVPETTTTDEELAAWTAAGARGVRFHQLPGGALGWDELEPLAARVHNFGWHVQLQMNGREFSERLDRLKALPGVLVVDHVGRFMDPVDADDPSFKALMALVDAGNCWVKLSAPYESSVDGLPDFDDVTRLARALVKAAPERMLWASNWPHPNQKIRYDDADMLDLLLDWADDEATRNRILSDNPAELYGF